MSLVFIYEFIFVIIFRIYNPNATNQLANYLPVPACAINSLAYVEYRNDFYIFGGRKDGSIVVYEGNETSPLVVLKAHTMNGISISYIKFTLVPFSLLSPCEQGIQFCRVWWMGSQRHHLVSGFYREWERF